MPKLFQFDVESMKFNKHLDKIIKWRFYLFPNGMPVQFWLGTLFGDVEDVFRFLSLKYLAFALKLSLNSARQTENVVVRDMNA